MLFSSFLQGFRALRRRPGLSLLLYGVTLALALIVAAPVYSALHAIVGDTGYGPELAARFDVVLWADILDALGPTIAGLFGQLFWVLALFFVWKAAAGVGLAHALRGQGGRSFWDGVTRFTGRSVLVGLLFLLPAAVGIVGAGLATGFALAVWSGEVAAFWIGFVGFPLAVVAWLALVDLMHDYARIALVIDGAGVWDAVRTGLAWPFRHRAAFGVYALWFLLALPLLALPTLLDTALPAGTLPAILLLFGLQQVFLLARSAASVGWVGSEVALFERVRDAERPLIAEAQAEEPDAATVA